MVSRRAYGNPAHLKPVPDAVLATALAGLAGDLAELAALAAPDDAAVHQVRAEVNEAGVAAEPSLMAQGVFRSAARQPRRVSC